MPRGATGSCSTAEQPHFSTTNSAVATFRRLQWAGTEMYIVTLFRALWKLCGTREWNMSKLVCLGGINKGEVYQLAGGDNTIGRGENNSIRIFDKKSSRNHCKIVRDGDELVFVDLESTNGSRVNNVFVKEPVALKAGDHIHIGQTVFLVSAESSQKSQPIKPPQEAEELPESTREKYVRLLQKTSFRVSETSTIRKLKNEKNGRHTGYLAYFKVENAE